MKKIFAFPMYKHKDGRDVSGDAVTEEGEMLTGHISSDIEWLKHDLGCPSEHGPPWKHDIYNTRFGEGNWSIEWLDECPDELYQKMEAWKISHPK